MTDKSEVEIITPPTNLRDRVAQKTGEDVDLSAADAVIEKLGVEFVARLPNDLAAIQHVLDDLNAEPKNIEHRKRLFSLVHDLKGQAGTFDYMLISVIGNDLCRFIERPMKLTPRCLKVAGFYVDAMRRVYDLRLTGDGGDKGMEMVNTLHSMTQKVLQE